MKRKEILKVVIFYFITFTSMIALMWIVFENFGYSDKNFMVIVSMLIPISFLFGYILSKVALEPLFVTNDMLDRLLKDTLHELNIPLSTIFANVSMLKRGEEDKKRLRRLERIEEAGKNLSELYEDLDYFIKKEIGSVKKERFDLFEIVENSVRKIEDYAKDISIRYEKFNFIVNADKRGCQKAIDNLLSNAVKYNKIGGDVKLFFNNGYLVIKDSGIGMDEDTIFHIFDRYYQGDSGASGYGIGLHIVKTFCDEHEVRIELESKKGFGTTFKLKFEAIGAEN